MASGFLPNLYRWGATAAVPVAMLALGCSRRGRRRFLERLGSWGDLPETPWWFHGASVGEVSGVLPVIREVQRQRVGEKILVSASSPTGLDVVESIADATRLLPLDAPYLVSRALSSLRAKHLVVTETELWPALFSGAMQRGLRCSVVNGRISDATIGRYSAFRSLFTQTASKLSAVCVCSEEHRERFIMLGAPSEQVFVTGNSKYDVVPETVSPTERRSLLGNLFGEAKEETPTLVLGSLRPGEEAWWLASCERVWARGGALRVVVAPRHLEKVGYFEKALAALPSGFRKWSLRGAGQPVAAVSLIDEMGALKKLYGIADAAFIGGTIAPIGGHNPLEAAMYGVPVALGPNIHVIKDVVSEMESRRGVVAVTGLESVESFVERIAQRDQELVHLGLRGKQAWELHRGAAARIAAILLRDEHSIHALSGKTERPR